MSQIIRLLRVYNGTDQTGLHHGVVTGVTAAAGVIRTCGYFDGSDYIRITDATDLNFGSAMTVTFWCKVPSVSALGSIIGQYDYTANQRSWLVWVLPANYTPGVSKGSIGFWASSNGSFSEGYRLSLYTSVSVDDGEWHHVAFTFNSGTVSCWIDGESAALTAAYNDGITSLHDATVDLMVGTALSSNSSAYRLTGSLEDIQVYNTALSESEILTIYNTRINSPLIAWYATNTGIDRTGNHNGTPTSVTPITGKKGVAGSFNGTTSKIDCGADWIGKSACTISAWIYLNSWGEGSVGNGLGRIIDNGKILFYCQQSGTSLYFTSDLSVYPHAEVDAISLGSWIHVAVTRNTAGVANFYVNGILSGTADQASGAPTVGTNILIGNNSAATRTFDGIIDDLRIYDEVLSADQIYNIYRGLNVSILAHYDMSTGTDVTGKHSGTPTNVTSTTGNIGVAGSFNGTTSKIDCGVDWIGTQNITVSCWCYANSYGESYYPRIVDNGKFLIYPYGDVAQTPVKGIRLTNNGGTTYAVSGLIDLVGAWHHIAITRTTDGLGSIYVDGELSGSAGQSMGTPTAVDTTNVILGNNSAGTRTFDGIIEDLRIYNEILPASQIAAMYDWRKKSNGIELGKIKIINGIPSDNIKKMT